MDMQKNKVSVDRYGVKIGREYKTLLCASLFYFRIPRSAWQARIDALLRSGYNTADVYFPWNFHEREEGKFDFEGERDVCEFLKLCAESGLYVIARFGPYICSEWTGGAIPAWVAYKSEKIRTNDAYFLSETMKWYGQILPKIVPYQYGRGGSVIMAQIENELDFFDCDDVEGYISVLRDKVVSDGVEVPVFCCAGQGNAVTSGGRVDGVLPTYNFYPDIRSKNFDGQLFRYARILSEENRPLLVTETGRETALHKREFAGGAKLIGAYNQVAGSNFEYYQSVNNWGNVASAIVTEYDFDSMIDVLGRYTPEVCEARLFTKMLSALGERAAKAAVSSFRYSLISEFDVPTKINALCLEGGGELICVANLSEKTGKASIPETGVHVTVRGLDTVLLPVKVEFEGGVILSSNYEIYSLKPLILFGEGKPEIKLSINGKLYMPDTDGVYGGVCVTLKSKEEMKSYDEREAGGFARREERAVCLHFEKYVGDALEAAAYREVNGECSFEANGIWYGGACYRFETSTKEVLFVDPADFMTIYDGETYAGTTFERGKSKILKFNNHRILVRSEKWGACNFDESRERSLRIKSSRGVKNFYDVVNTIEAEEWQLTFQYFAGGNGMSYTPNIFDPIVGLNGYNSTKMPFEALCYRPLEAEKGASVFFSLENGTAECALYVSGKYAGEIRGDRNYVDITPFLKDGCGELQLAVRKRDWCERVGDAKIYVCRPLKAEICELGEKYMRGLRAVDAVKRIGTVCLEAGEIKAIELDLAALRGKDCVCAVTGNAYKLTAVSDGKVIARMIAPSWTGVVQQGGSKEKFFMPAAWRKDDKVVIYAESIGNDTKIDFRIEY